MDNTNSAEIKLENDLLAPVRWTRASKIWLGSLLVAFLICLFFYYLQLRNGLIVTGLHDYVAWGIYISNFVFFVATSLIGMLISSIIGLSGAKWILPIARIAEILALGFAMLAGLIIITDMGRPDRLLNVFIHGRIQSPILWDVTVVITYVALSFLLLYVPLVPDIALCRDKLKTAPKWQQKIYAWFSLGFNYNPLQYKRIELYIKILMIAIIPVALSIHTVTSWLFAMTLRAGWDTPIFGPYFVSGAFVAGCACVIIAMYFFRKNYKLENYITHVHFNVMGKLLVLVSLVYVYFNINEIIVPAYKLRSAEAGHITSLLIGEDALMFWLVQIGGLILPFLLLLLPVMRKPLPLTIIASVVLIAAWFKRYLIVVPTQLHPYLPIQNVPDKFHHYSPTVPEVMITLASFILLLIIITVVSKIFPVISIWEMKHHENHKTHNE